MTSGTEFDILVGGGGVTGAAAALALSRAGFRVALCAPPSPVAEARTAALFQPSLEFLAGLGWTGGDATHCRLRALRMIDRTTRLFRAPEITFHASEAGLEAFGVNLANGATATALVALAEAASNVTVFGLSVRDLSVGEDAAEVRLDDGRVLTARLVVGADGRGSRVRHAAGIETRVWNYPQAALVAVVGAERDHGEVSTEFHFDAGPLTLVPFGRRRASVVWMDRPEAIGTASRLGTGELADLLSEKTLRLLGRLTLETPCASYPLGAAVARSFVGPRVALIGDAAHSFPPIGAQGLNLGLRDAATLADILGGSRGDPGSPEVLRRYEAERRGDVTMRTFGVDLLDRSLFSSFPPFTAGRSVALSLARRSAVVRKAMMRAGIGVRAQPRPPLSPP